MRYSESELENLRLALQYAALGWPCFPVWGIKDGRCLCGGISGCRPGKHPYGPAVPHGHHDGSTDPDMLRQWFCTPFINVGVDVGRCQALVLDPDAKHGGLETLARLESDLGPLPEGPLVETGGGGRHIWLAGSPTITKNGKLPGGIDVLVTGAVIMPPSLHLSGRRYRSLRPPELPLPLTPPAWLEYIVSTLETRQDRGATHVAGEFDPMRGQVATVGLTFATLGRLPAGERNEPVNRCIGSMLNAGLSEAEILAAGEQWAEDQEPPYRLADLKAKVRAFAHKDSLKIGECWSDDDLTAAEEEVVEADTPLLLPQTSSVTASAVDADLLLPPPPTAPILTVETPTPVEPSIRSLPGAAYHGLFGDYLQAVVPLTEADAVGVLLSCMTAFGSALGREPFLKAGSRHRGNLFLLLIGLTADRKNTAWDVGSMPIKLADPGWAKTQLQPGFGTGEGVVYAIRDDQERQEPVKEKGTTTGYTSITVPGVLDKRLCVVEEEFVKVLTLCRRESSTLSAIIRAAWGGSPLGFANKTSADRCEEPHVTCVGMVTPSELLTQTAGRSEVTNGMLNRFLLCRVKKHGCLPFGGGWDEVAASFAVPFQAALEQAKCLSEIGWSDEAADLWRVEYEKWSAPRDGAVGSVTARAADQILRLALLYAVVEGSDHILLPHLQAALALYDHCDQTAEDLFTPQPGVPADQPDQPLHVQLLAAIRQHPGLRRSDLSRRFSHTSAPDLNAALSLLQGHALAYSRAQATAGRQAECWYPGGGDDGTDDAKDGDEDSGTGDGEAADGDAEDGPTGGGVANDLAETADPLAAEEEDVEPPTG